MSSNIIKNFITIGTCWLLVTLLLVTLLLTSCKNPFGDGTAIDSGFHPGITPSLEKSMISVSAPTVQSGGTVVLTVQINDQNDNPFTTPLSVSFNISGGTATGSIGNVINHGNGLYSAIFSAVFPGTPVTVNASVNNQALISKLPTLTVIMGPLTITSITPQSTFLEGGKTLTINGTGFVSGLTVTIGGSVCSSVTVPSATQLTCVNPMHAAGLVNVQLTRSDATTATLTNSFTYSSILFTTADLVNGALSTHGSNNGITTAARFHHPTDLVENSGILYVSDTKNNLIRQINLSTGVVSDLAGVRGLGGSTNGLGSNAKFKGPTGLAVAGNYLYVSDTDNCAIRRIDLSTTEVTTWAGTIGNCVIAVNGTVGSNIKFAQPWGLATDGISLYVADSQSYVIQKIDIATITSTIIAGSSGTCGGVDGTGTSAQFCSSVGIALVGTNLFVGDTWNYKIRKVDIALNPAAVTSFVGLSNTAGSTDGIGSAAKFKRMGDIASDGTYLYIADSGNDTLRKVEISTGSVTTVAGTAGSFGFLNGTGGAAKLYRPGGMALVGTTLYFTDMGNNAIRTFNTLTGAVSAYAGYGGL